MGAGMYVATLTKGIVSSYLTNNGVEISELPKLVEDVGDALRSIMGASRSECDPPKQDTGATDEE
jgi:predicted transcriptional regulator